MVALFLAIALAWRECRFRQIKRQHAARVAFLCRLIRERPLSDVDWVAVLDTEGDAA